MSRIGRLPISLPAGVTVSLDHDRLLATGPKGELALKLHPHVSVSSDGQTVRVSVKHPEQKHDRALWGLFRVLINNMVHGVTQGYERKLEIQGIGYRAEAKGDALVLLLGYSQPITYPLAKGISAKVEKNIITISGIDKQQVGEAAAEIRRLRKPEPYKGKGIRYLDEVVRRKAGKVVKAAGAK